MAISALRQQGTVTSGEIALNAKTMTLDDAIAHLDNTLSDTGRKWSCESCRMEHVQLRAWLDELRYIKRKRNAPLTLDELREMDGEPVWVEFQDGSGGCWGLVHITMFNHIVFANGLFCRVGKPYYGKTWLAYRQKPEEGTV